MRRWNLFSLKSGFEPQVLFSIFNWNDLFIMVFTYEFSGKMQADDITWNMLNKGQCAFKAW